MTCTATPPVISHTPAPTEFTIDTVKVGAISENKKIPVSTKPAQKKPNVGSPALGADQTQLLTSMSALSEKDKATAKGVEITKIKNIPKTRKGEYYIEVVSINAIEGGVEVFARAWDANNNPIGFGKDGTVEIERFRIFNPPITVPDGTKTVKPTGFKDFTYEEEGMKEDIPQALLNDLRHTISVKQQKFNGSKIIAGKIGNTTDTYYSSNSADDSQPGRVTVNETFATIRAGAGTRNVDTAGPNNIVFEMSATTNQYDYLERVIAQFDASAITDTDTIDSATISLYTTATGGELIGGNINVDRVSGISATTPASTDYAIARWDSTNQSDTTMTVATMNGSAGYKDFTLNATGLGNVSKTAVFGFGFRFSGDQSNTAPSWVSGNYDYYQAYQHEDADSAKYPKLVVEHSAVGGGGAVVPDDGFIIFQ